MREILHNAGFTNTNTQEVLPCCRYEIYHKTVDNNLCSIGVGVGKNKFFIKYKGQKRNHIANHNSSIDNQLLYELENNGLLTSVAQ